MFVSPQNSYAESLEHSMTIFGDRPLQKYLKLKGVIGVGPWPDEGLSFLHVTTQQEESMCTPGRGHPTNSPADLGLGLLAQNSEKIHVWCLSPQSMVLTTVCF